MAVDTQTLKAQTNGYESSELKGAVEGPGGRIATVAHSAFRGAVAAMAMTGMRVFTVHTGIVKETPPETIFRERAKALLKPAPRKRRPAVIELAHWSYGALGGAVFGMLPEGTRRRAWAGPAYGLAVWVGFEGGVAPALRLDRPRKMNLVERSALITDHLLYGLVLSELRSRPRD
jgi:hypothetical protein